MSHRQTTGLFYILYYKTDGRPTFSFLPKNGGTPRQYYARMNDEQLIGTLCGHLQGGVPVPEFLCAEVEKRRPTERILSMLDSSDEETALYAVHFIGDDEQAFDKYFSILEKGEAGEDVENEVADNLYERSDLDYLIYNDPLAYADLVLNGDVEAYLNAVTEYKAL